MSKKLIVLEINEVPYRVIDSYIADNPNSNWASVLQRSAKFIAATPDQIQLHPKLSWQTFHRAVPDTEHGFVEYNQKDAPGKDKYPPVWEIIRAAGKRIGVGASIGSYPMPEDNENIDFYIADPFAPTFETVPEYLGSFQRMNNLAVQRSGRNVRKGGFGVKQLFDLAINLPRLGISPSTIMKTFSQLMDERRDNARIVRRRNIQALMSFDVVFKQIKKQKPDFSTIFANHVAASMHRYWAAKFVDDYEVNRMPEAWRETYGGEIDNAMDEADYMMGKLNKFVADNPEFSVMVIASMGQEAIEHEVIHNQLIIGEFDSFMTSLGFADGDYNKLTGMEPEYVVEFTKPELLDKFKEVCAGMSINGQRPTVKPSSDSACAFLVFQNNVDIESITVGNREVSLADAGLVIDEIQDMSGSTAQHVRGGCCFVFNGHSDLSHLSSMDSEYDLVAVTSSIVSALGVETRPYMKNPLPSVVQAINDEPPGKSEKSATQVTA